MRRLNRTSSARQTRQKLSTTIAQETHDFLQGMVKRGQAASIADALDAVVSRIRKVENRRRLALATSRYFEQLDPQAALEENALSRDLASASSIDFDHEI